MAAGVALVYSLEVLFQPDVFSEFDAAVIARSVAGRFFEALVMCCAIAAAVAWVERRQHPHAGRYALELIGAVFAASAVAMAVWALFVYRPTWSEAAPYLLALTCRFTVVGVFIALVDGFRRRLRIARARERELQLAQAALQAQTGLARLRLLEAQIEPHFLFNTIANVRRTWRLDPELGRRMHENVLRYLAASLPQMRSPCGTLGEEFELVRAYLELFALRMGPRLRFSIELPAGLAELRFPRMLLITLVENAIKHGIAPSDDGGEITLRAWCEGRAVSVSVSDDGVGFGAAETGGTGIGLANIRARLLTQYGGAARLSIGAGPGGGVEATIRLRDGGELALAFANEPSAREAGASSAVAA